MKKATRRPAEAPRPQLSFTPCCCAGAGPRISALMASTFQGPVFDHFRAASVEVLLGLRAILDAQIQTLSRAETKKGTRVPVE